MGSLLRHTRAFCIAFAAIVGLVSAPDDARAGVERERDCCVSRPMTDCGCCVAEAEPTRLADPSSLTVPPATSLDAAGRSCGCNLDTPGAPASKTDRPAAERRCGAERAGLTHLRLIPVRPAAPVGPHVSPGDSSAEAPLYRLTSHFRC